MLPSKGAAANRLDESKTIGDPEHGSIRLSPLELQIMQLPAVNRLHHVRQLSMAYYVFPSAQSSRFAHSIGALYVGGQIAFNLLNNLPEGCYDELFTGRSHEEVIETVRLACMLHDLGHGPFSHISEGIMEKCLRKNHPTEASEAVRLFGTKSLDKVPVHEYYSYKIASSGEISELIQSAGLDPSMVTSLLAKNPKKKNWSEEAHQILRKAISSQLDADRMDYLLRDRYATGVPYGDVDIRRLISNLMIFENRSGRHFVAIHERAQSTIEHMLNARLMMYKWVYAHHMVVACDELMKRAMEFMISSRRLRLEDFHWKAYSEGHTDDSEVWHALSTSLTKDQGQFLPFKGLIDIR